MTRIAHITTAAVTQGQVVHALILREIKSRFGRQKLGYLWAVLEPTAFTALFAIMAMYAYQTTLSGMPAVQFMVTGVAPFILFRNTMNQTMGAIETNRVLLAFPKVTLVDLVVARAVLEITTLTVVVFVLLAGVHAVGYKVHIEDPLRMLLPLACLALTGFGLGAIFAALAPLFRSTQQLIPIVTGRPLFFLSGLFFTADMMPEAIREILLLNPILHMIEWLRSAVFVEFESTHVSIEYALGSTLVAVFLGLVMLRGLGKRILAAV